MLVTRIKMQKMMVMMLNFLLIKIKIVLLMKKMIPMLIWNQIMIKIKKINEVKIIFQH
jgi:hypothetical protein